MKFPVIILVVEISFLGHSCFRIKGKNTILLTDPFAEEIGFSFPKTTADIITVSHQHHDHNNAAAVMGTIRRSAPFVVAGPGEYEIAGVFIYGIPSFHDAEEGAQRGGNTIYVINMDGVRLAHLGDLGHKLSDRQLEEVNGVDVLMIPVGGNYTLSASEAVAVIGQVEPKVVIPMHYKMPGVNIDIAPVEDFVKEVGLEAIKKEEKLVIYADRLPEERQIVILNARNQNSAS